MLGVRKASVIAAFAAAPVLLLVAGIGLHDRSASAPGPVPEAVEVSQVADAAAMADLGATIDALQGRLRALPGDYDSWSSLGFAYVAQARATADPSYYPKAAEAFDLVLAAEPADALALTGQAALANARHDFTTGRELAEQAVALDPYDSTARGVLTDALLELGSYDEAWPTLQAMVDLRPGVASYTRVAYSYELRGDIAGARYALEQALAVAQSAPDISFVLFHLGELAFGEGDYETAARHFADGLRRDPANVPLLAGQAKVSAARGDMIAAVRDYATVVERLPQPIYLVEYGELLDSLGRHEQAQAQFDVASAAAALFTAAGVQPDIEVALYDSDHGRITEALVIAQAHYETRRSVQVEDALAWALHASGRDEEALQHAVAAQQLGTRSALWDYHRGMIQLALGLEAEARASLESALTLSPAFSPLHAPRARAALDALGPAA